MIRFLNALLRLAPDAYRREFGGEVLAHIERELADTRDRGSLALARFTLSTALDLLRTAMAERWDPSVITPQHHLTRRKGMRWLLNDWLSDLRHASRRLRHAPGFAAISIGTLGLAVGAAAVIFSVVYAVLLRPLPYANANRLVYIAASAPGTKLPAELGVGLEFYVQYRERSKLLEDASIVTSFTSTMRVGDRVERIRMSSPTWSFFNVLGARPLLGRFPVEDDRDHVAVLSYQLWQSWFGGDSTVLGKSYFVGGANREIIGVAAPTFGYPSDGTMIWFPVPVRTAQIQPGDFGQGLIARMRPGVTIAQLTAELNTLASQIPERFGGTPRFAEIMTHHRAVVRSLSDDMIGQIATPLWVLLGAMVIVLMIACANVANLILVRTESRQRDLAVRRAIGARRGQLIRMQLSEALLIAIGAGVVAVVLARLGLPVLVRLAPQGIPRLGAASISGPALLFTALAALVSALACGLTPAIRASEPDLTRLRDGGRGTTRRGNWLRDGLVIGQTALALVLLISSGLLFRSFSKLAHVDPGYNTQNIFTFQIAPRRPSLNDGPTFAQFHTTFMERLRALPGVQSVGVVDNVPLDEGTGNAEFRSDETEALAPLHFTFTGGDYFKTMSIPVLRGRTFTQEEALAVNNSALLSRAAADLLFPGKDPVGRRIKRDGDSTWSTVVGVVGGVMQNSFRDKPEAVIYYPMTGPTPGAWGVGSPAYVVKTPRAEIIAPEVLALVHELAPEAPMYRVFTMASLATRTVAPLTFNLLTLGIAAGLALILGTVGLYGVLSYVVAQRTREIGVRMALGAEASGVRRMIVMQGTRVVAIGAAIGVIVALVSTRALSSLLFGVAPIDIVTFGGMSALLLAVGMLASYLPARHASNVDPIESLRGD